jgi:aminoglycoside phosphotransferase (APT) family kinase protein
VLPAEGGRCADLAERITTGIAGAVPDQPTHGDLYEGQLLVDGSRITGLLDVDTAGPGRRTDDLACLFAHARVLAQIRPLPEAERLLAVEAGWRASAERVVDAEELRLRTAGVLLSLATGPHRVQEAGWEASTTRRIDLVERCLEDAANPLEPSSAPGW